MAFVNPGFSLVTAPASLRARHVRVTATSLQHRANERYGFALAEFQVYSGNDNVALGSAVSYLDSLEDTRHSKARFLTDGARWKFRLGEWPEFLRGLSRRRELLAQLALIDADLATAHTSLQRILLWSGLCLLLATALVMVVVFYRMKLRRIRETDELRRRIAADLHDDLGSNLAAIGMLTDLGLQGRAPLARTDLEELHALARGTGLPGMNGLEGIVQIKAIAPKVLIVVLTVFEDDEKIYRAICAGASGYLVKTAPLVELDVALNEVAAGGSPMTPRVARRVLEMFTRLAPQPLPQPLSARERQVLGLMADMNSRLVRPILLVPCLWWPAVLYAQGSTIPVTAASIQGAADSAVIELSPFTVSAEQDCGYQAQSSLAGSRLRSNLKDVASPVSAFTEKFFLDTAITDTQGVAAFMLSTEYDFAEDAGNQNNQFGVTRPLRMRGIQGGEVTTNFFKAGGRSGTFSTERIDQSRGPNSVLFGIGCPGGIINVTTKRARLDRSTGSAALQVRSEGGEREEADYNQVVVKDRLGVRAAAANTRFNSWRNYEFNDESRSFGTARWQISDDRCDLRLGIQGSRSRVHRQPDVELAGVRQLCLRPDHRDEHRPRDDRLRGGATRFLDAGNQWSRPARRLGWTGDGRARQ